MDFTPQSRNLIGAGVGVVLLISLGLYFFLGQGEEPVPVQETVAETLPPPPPPPPPPAPEPEPEPFELPLLSDSDAFVRELVSALSAHPGFAAWLVTDDLIRRFVVAVENVANRRNPAQHVTFMKPDSRFQTEGDEPEMLIAPASYRRYDGVTQIIASLDTNGTSQLYRQLLPLMNEAYAELGIPDATFSDSVLRAIVHVLETPVIEGRPMIESRASFYYEYTDPVLEGLSAPQKQLLGIGPENLRTIQQTIRDIATAIDITNLPRGTVLVR